jgi:L-amino acid N-acyltransferase YncA
MHGGNATFETRVPSWQEWAAAHLSGHRLVAEVAGRIVGWAALAPVSPRAVYAGVAEDSVYVAASHGGRGIGRALLEALIDGSERAGIWTLQAGVFPENHASLRLHERCGFRVLGVRERLACRDGIWRDVVLMERRSARI